jgi:hypothetical protein
VASLELVQVLHWAFCEVVPAVPETNPFRFVQIWTFAVANEASAPRMSSYAWNATVVAVLAGKATGTVVAALGVEYPMIAHSTPARGLTATFSATRKK